MTPRARREGLVAALPLSQLIEPILAKFVAGAIEIVGPAGSGKSTALAHLATAISDERRVTFIDDADVDQWKAISELGLTIFTSDRRTTDRVIATFFLAGWTFDDCMEYLATAHRDRARSVLSRLKEDPSHGFSMDVRCSCASRWMRWPMTSC